MTLLYLSLAGICGILAGHALWERGAFGCGLPAPLADWLWAIPLLLAALTPLLNRFEREPMVSLTWPASAGFRAPRRRPRIGVLAACALFFCAGVLRIAGRPLYPCWTRADLAFYNQPAILAYDYSALRVTVRGTVSAYVPQPIDSTRMTIAAHSIELPSGATPVTGQMTLIASDTLGLQYGDPVAVRGVLSQPPEFPDFSYRDYLAHHGIYSQMAIAQVHPAEGEPGGNPLLRTLYAVRARGEALINASLPEPYAALANGILLGIDANIPDALLADFNITSSTHVLVISGSNVALITGVLMAIGFYLFGRKGAALWALAGVILYALLVGAEPSVLRAAWMGALVVISIGLGRQSTALVSLGAASLALILINPFTLWDVGFQLSAMATAGLVLLSPRGLAMTRRLFVPRPSLPGETQHAPLWSKPAHAVADALVVTLAATIAVTPLLIFYFHRMSVIGLLTNLLIAPVQPLILFAGMGALSAGLAGVASLASALFGLTWAGLAWTVAVVQRSAGAPWAGVVIGGFGAAEVLVAYAVIGIVLWQTRQRPIFERRKGPSTPAWQRAVGSPASMAVAAAAGFLLWSGVAALPDGRLHLYALPASGGMSLLIETPSGGQTLIDGGTDAGRLLTNLGAHMRPWDRTLDLAVLSRDSARTIEAQTGSARRLTIANALATQSALDAHLEWADAMKAAGGDVAPTAAGGWVDMGDGASLRVLSPRAGEEGPLVLWLEYGDFAALILGATPGKPLAEVGWSLPRRPTLLILPDAGAHGEERSQFAADVAAEQVIAFGGEVLRSEVSGSEVSGSASDQRPRYVDADGAVEVATDGAKWGVAE